MYTHMHIWLWHGPVSWWEWQEEEKYWQDVMQRAQQRGPKSDAALKDTKQTAKRREPENVVTRIRRWRPVPPQENSA